MELKAEHYFQAATQRSRQALNLYREGRSFALAIYVGGVAVECMLRAFKMRRDPTFDERHDLLRLFAASGMLRTDPEKMQAHGMSDSDIENHLHGLNLAVNEIVRLWANDYRYASEERLVVHLKRITGYKRVKGDYLKNRARRFLDSVEKFIAKGVLLWPF